MKARVLFSTLRHLKPIQFFYRIKNKITPAKKTVFKNVDFCTIDLFIDGLHNDSSYLNRFATNQNSIEVLNQTVKLDYKNISSYLPLVQFNIEYFEYAIVWAQKGIQFGYLKEKWTEYIAADLPLHPYIVSLQIPNMIIAMGIYGCHDKDIYDELYSRYRWLISHQEKHLLANHYFENLKAIVIASRVFKEERVYEQYVKKLLKECKEEILEDGVHFELSLMYHKIILEDLLLVRKVCEDSRFDTYIKSMLDALYSLESGFNRTLLFNDAGDNVSKSSKALIDTCRHLLNVEPKFKNCFDRSGYYVLSKPNISVIVDAGKIGPNYNPGHSHCDCLSFELSIEGEPVLVNSGTYQYQGDKRLFFRSTIAHNTLMISGHEQSELWGEHRAGRRNKKNCAILKGDTFVGSFLNQFNERHCRKIVLSDDSIAVVDTLEMVKSGEKVESFLHLAPAYTFKDGFIVGPKARYSIIPIDSSIRIADSVYSDEFGKIECNQCLVFEWLTDKKEHGYIINLNKKETKND